MGASVISKTFIDPFTFALFWEFLSYIFAHCVNLILLSITENMTALIICLLNYGG